MKKTEEIGFATLLVIIFAVFVIMGWGYAKRPRIVPLTLSIPGLALSVIHLANSIVKFKRAGKKQQTIVPEAAAQKPHRHQKPSTPGENRKILEIWAWIISLALGINFFGFMITIPIFLLVFLRFFAKRSWKISTLIAASFILAVYLVFYVGLRTTL